MDTLLWIISKLLRPVFSLDKLLLILLVLGTILLWTRRQRAGKWLVSLAAAALLSFAILPVGGWLLLPLEDRFPPPKALPENVDGIIALGGAELSTISAARGQPSLSEAAERLTTFAALARRYPQARLVFTGGLGRLSQKGPTSAETARTLLEQIGMDVDRILFDHQSRNTWENAKRSLTLANPQPGENWVLITSAYHMPRSVGVFRKVGWKVIPYPVDYYSEGPEQSFLGSGNLSSVEFITRWSQEWMGILAYWMMGRTSELLPGPEHQIN